MKQFSVIGASDMYKKTLQQEIDAAAAYVDHGKCASFEEYKQLTGKLFGLRSALDYFKTLADKVEND